jgi:hypothetical protein
VSTSAPPPQPNAKAEKPDGKPVERLGWFGWREIVLTRASEYESLHCWVLDNNPQKGSEALSEAIRHHLEAAREAARAATPWPRNWIRYGALVERAWSNLDATEVFILDIAAADHVLGQMPSLLRHVQSHLLPTDPRRQQLERIAEKVRVKDSDHPLIPSKKDSETLTDELVVVVEERGKIVTAARAASSAALREQVRLRSFRNVVAFATVLMTVLAVGVAITGYRHKTWIPLCFAPEISGEVVVVCPTTQSAPLPATVKDIDGTIEETATSHDLLIVELVGLTAAAIAAAAAIRRIRGSSEPFGLPVALAALKLPTGAITAFLGLLLMRGRFVPGLTALDTSAQILAWALVFGYAQQLFTRLVDQQGHTVLENVRAAGRPAATPPPP